VRDGNELPIPAAASRNELADNSVEETGFRCILRASSIRRFSVRKREIHSAALPLALVMLLFPACLAARTANGDQQPPQPNAPDPAYNLKVQVPLVLEDLVVKDRNGDPVKGLQPSDFTITENGKPVTLRHFEEHATAQSSASLALPNLGPNTFTNLIAAPENSPLNILLLDVLNTPMADQEAVRQQMLNYLGTLPPGVPVAIFQLDTELHLLQGFSADPALLRAAIDKGRNIVRSPRLTDKTTVSDIDPMIYLYLSDVVKGLGLSAQSINDVKRVEADRRANGGQDRAILTRQALIQLGRYLSGLSGRKSLIWFSASFPVGALPDILVRNRVAVYPVDARGIMPVLTEGQDTGAALSAFDQSQMSQHNAMAKLAESTGGEAFYDTNDFKKAAAKAISDGDNFYTFTYTPPDGKLDGSFRKIEVKCKRPGLRLSYRTGYVAVDPNTLARAANSPAPSALQDSLRLGAPAATQILFAVKLNPEGASADRVSTGAKPNATLMKPPYRRYELDYSVDIGNALFTTSPDGVRHGSLDFAVLVYTPEGVLANQTVNKINLDLTPARYVEMMQRGLKIGQLVEAPVKGNYFLRVLVYDPKGDRVGATEIPLADLQSKRTEPDNAPNRAQLVMPR
jgi:VWFA-related protein